MQFPVVLVLLIMFSSNIWAQEEPTPVPEPEPSAEQQKDGSEDKNNDSNKHKEIRTTDEAEEAEPDCD